MSTTTTRNDTAVGRFYTLPTGEHVPSVTHILSVIAKPALVPWAAREERVLVMEAAALLYGDLRECPPMPKSAYLTTLEKRLGQTKAHKRQSDKALEIGSQTHALVEWWVRRKLGHLGLTEPVATEKARWGFDAFVRWAESVNLRPLMVEEVLWSRTHGYAGTMDLLADVNGVRTLVDLKTSKAIYAEYFLQVAAYAKALGEMGHGEPAQGIILRLPKTEHDPAFEAVPCPPFAESFPSFLAARQLWTWWHAQEVAYAAKRKAAAA